MRPPDHGPMGTDGQPTNPTTELDGIAETVESRARLEPGRWVIQLGDTPESRGG
jgi:hypothetical protein